MNLLLELYKYWYQLSKVYIK